MNLSWYVTNCHYGQSLSVYSGGREFPPGMAIDRETFVDTAREAEALGFTTLWLGDHIIIPPTTSVAFGAMKAGDPLRADAPIYDSLAVLSYLAAVTTTVKLGIGVLVIPYRDPILTAKMLATIDQLSGGRVIAGAASGWLKDEFETLGVSYENRGRITDDYLAVMQALWTQDFPRYDGEHYSLDGRSPFLPKPVNGTIPIWIGGHTNVALRRVVRFGDGYLAGYLAPAEAGAWRLTMRQRLEDVGRDPDTVPYGGQTRFYVTDEPYADAPPCIGSARKVADDIMRFHEAGLEELKLAPPPGPDRKAVLGQLRRFADDVRPLLDL